MQLWWNISFPADQLMLFVMQQVVGLLLELFGQQSGVHRPALPNNHNLIDNLTVCVKYPAGFLIWFCLISTHNTWTLLPHFDISFGNLHSCCFLPSHSSSAICSELPKGFRHIRSEIEKHCWISVNQSQRTSVIARGHYCIQTAAYKSLYKRRLNSSFRK